MATIPTYITWVAGTVVTAAQMNANIRDAGNFQQARPYCNVFNNAGVTCSTSGTYFLVPWDTETEDNDSMHNNAVNPSRITFNTTGVYHITNCSSWASNATGYRGQQLRLNSGGSSAGGTQLQFAFVPSIGATAWNGGPRMSWYYRAANIGDYLELFVDQTSGGSLATIGGAVATNFQCMWEIA